jgi:acyl carrier protein
MNREEIQAKIIVIAADQVGVDPAQVTPATHFINDLEYDSLDAVNFAMEVEDALRVTIPDDKAEKLQTVDDAITFVVDQLSAVPANPG